MPVEVRELVIKANIVQEGSGTPVNVPPSGTNNNVSANEEIITLCVEKVLEILKDKHGR
jgi:hypothetical protein